MKKLIKNIIGIILITIFLITIFCPISIGVQKKEDDNIELDCNINIQTVANIGNTIQIISNKSSANSSVEIYKIVQYLKAQDITIQQIQDVSGNIIELTDTKLIGTGTSLIADDETQYSAIVYGDATGDGKIDAADISVIVSYFLGNNTKISQANKIAADVQQDGELNSADISRMISSFLGNLDGDILKKDNTSIGGNEPSEDNPTQDNTNKKISEVVKIGDYIDYPITYTNVNMLKNLSPAYWKPDDSTLPTDTGWRVLSNENGVVKLMTAGCPERAAGGETKNLVNESKFKKYVDSRYAVSAIGGPTTEESKNTENFKWIVGKYWEIDNLDPEYAVKYWNGERCELEIGVLPVVTLKTDLINYGGTGTKEDPFKLAQ